MNAIAARMMPCHTNYPHDPHTLHGCIPCEFTDCGHEPTGDNDGWCLSAFHEYGPDWVGENDCS